MSIPNETKKNFLLSLKIPIVEKLATGVVVAIFSFVRLLKQSIF